MGSYFLRPITLIRTYRREDLGADLLAGITVAIILIPQAIAFAQIAELPPHMGLYTAIVGAVVGALWGSSRHLQTGPTNTTSLLVLSILLPLAQPGTQEYTAMAGLMAVMVGMFRLLFGLLRLGLLVSFVSDAVIVGFTAGAGILIGLNQLRNLLGLQLPSSPSLWGTLRAVGTHWSQIHPASLALGLGTIGVVLLFRRICPRAPGPLVAMALGGLLVWIFRLDQAGVRIVGELPRGFPPLARLPLLDWERVRELSTGALAVSIIGLIEATSIGRAIAVRSGQRLDSNQEFVGQGLANIASGLFSGYTCSGSFSRSAVSFWAGARTPFSGVFAGLFVLLALLLLAPQAAYIPRAALAGVLMVTAYDLIDRREMGRIWRGARGDAAIMTLTLLATLLLPLTFAVLSGVLASLAYYLYRTSLPRVVPVVPDPHFRRWIPQGHRPSCPQLAILELYGDLYFGAVSHAEALIRQELETPPFPRFLALFMERVNQCDITGIHMLERIHTALRKRGGGLYLVGLTPPLRRMAVASGLVRTLGRDHFFSSRKIAVARLFYHVLDPAVCVYECETRVFQECQPLPKSAWEGAEGPIRQGDALPREVKRISPHALWKALKGASPPLVVDVREPREFRQGHIPESHLVPLSRILSGEARLPRGELLVLVCRSGRRSTLAARFLLEQGYRKVQVLEGGILAWEAAGFLEAVGPQTLFGETRRGGR